MRIYFPQVDLNNLPVSRRPKEGEKMIAYNTDGKLYEMDSNGNLTDISGSYNRITEVQNNVNIGLSDASASISELTTNLSNTNVYVTNLAMGLSGASASISELEAARIAADATMLGVVKNHILSSEEMTINEGEQYIKYGDLVLEGIINLAGELVILDGELILEGANSILNLIGDGIYRNVQLKEEKVTKETIQFSTTGGQWLNINHQLNTIDIQYECYERREPIEVEFEIINRSSFRIKTITNITGRIVIS